MPAHALACPSSSTWNAVVILHPLACPCVVYVVIFCPTGSSLWCFSQFQFRASCSVLSLSVVLPLWHTPWIPVTFPCVLTPHWGDPPEKWQCLAQLWGLHKYLLSWARGSRRNLQGCYHTQCFLFVSPTFSTVKAPCGPSSWVSKHFISTGQCCPWQKMEEPTTLGGKME